MTVQVSFEEKYFDRFREFVDSLPKNAIKIDNMDDNSISMSEAKEKVDKAINGISSNNGLDLDVAFSNSYLKSF